MANKADRQYFENFIEASDYTCQASKYLVECLNNFNLDNIKAMLDTMHEFEHQGDDKHHEMSAMLAKAFVTPVDREDLAMISQQPLNPDEMTRFIQRSNDIMMILEK